MAFSCCWMLLKICSLVICVFSVWPQKHPLHELVAAAASYLLGENKQANKKKSLVQIQGIWTKINHRARLWSSLQKKLFESKSKVLIQKQQWKNIIETPFKQSLQEMGKYWQENMALCAFPLEAFVSVTRGFAPGLPLGTSCGRFPKAPTAHTNKVCFSTAQIAHTSKVSDEALLKMWAFYCQNITLQKGFSFCFALEEPQLSCCV